MTPRSQHAVLARIEISEDGVKLVMEDVKGGGDTWTVDALYTSKTFPSEPFLNVNLSASQLEEIGLVLISRLAVFRDFYERHDDTAQ